ncbi:MAG: alpha/beta hydrolase fold domain-containing protein [Caulobacterales bacterium]|nr:alpha/beta hydrolase fold domain-containing protein [Caulobacterales bacterium]
MEIPGPTAPLTARFYRSTSSTEPLALLLFFHGGGFAFGDIGTHDALCRRLAHGTKVAVLSVDYRLAPEHAWPAQRDDAEAALRWLLQVYPDTAASRIPLILGGDSAGGYLALDLTRQINRETPGTVALTCLIYPLLHLDDDLWKTANAGLRPIGRAAVHVIRARLVQSPPNLLEAGAASDPPCVLTYGGLADPVRPDCQAYEAALRTVGIPVHVGEFKSLPHGYANMTHLLPPARAAIDETARLLRRALEEA